ncbi:hypothetical protein CLV30_11348 [Haloactinopolyspora alba]|uniref:Uncharacterized protein n=1 Tax=Haloactinopolyspora alba TaxID=648780 RepID=A0A2P8DWF3_9ACTN|nr:hypothetical protein [Haloactinopolyspora alba]PSL01560.1 hypothetical protein CLV30_11348 [Haloactinopolyspora alba]
MFDDKVNEDVYHEHYENARKLITPPTMGGEEILPIPDDNRDRAIVHALLAVAAAANRLADQQAAERAGG